MQDRQSLRDVDQLLLSKTNTIKSAEIIRASEVLFQIRIKPFKNVRATTPPFTQECLVDLDS